MIPDDFLRAIIANKQDDLPRLVYADWLEEHGESERAEFIRLQCRVAAWPLHKCDSIYPGCTVDGNRVTSHNHKCEMYPFANRANQLLEISWADWLPKCVQGCYFYRGFAERITISWSDWLTHHEAILKVTPLERVVLTTMPLTEGIRSMFSVRYDGITFELPQERHAIYAHTEYA